MTNKTELLPCPFCGKIGNLLHNQEFLDINNDLFLVTCANVECLAVARSYMENTSEAAISAWNTRAKPTVILEGVLEQAYKTGWNDAMQVIDSGEVVPRKEVEELVGACKKTIKDNLHLADGDNCTLYVLREALAKFTDKRW